MSQPIVVSSSSGRGPGVRRPGAIRRRSAAVAAVMLLAGALVAPTAALGVANLLPVAAMDTVTGDEDTTLTGNVLANDSDADGGTLSVASLSYAPATGFSWASNGSVTYTPPPNAHGQQVLMYWLADGQGGLVQGYLVLNVTPVNDSPVASDDAATTTEDTEAAIAAATLLADDTDVEADALTVTGVSGATHGTVGLASGTVTFTPAADWCGDAGFDYSIADGHAGTDAGSVVVHVACVNDEPVAVDDAATVAQNAAATTIDVIGNDTDADGDVLTVTGATVTQGAGSVSVAAAGSIRFTPADLFEGDAEVAYAISDGHGGTATATLTVAVVKDEVAPVPTAPVVHLGVGRVDEKAPLAIGWSATDAGTGVASYEVQVSVAGGPWTGVSKGAARAANRLLPFRSSLVFRVRATDRAGNVSAWVTAPARRATDYQAPGSPSVGYAGTWTSVTSASASGNGYRMTTASGATASLRFSGREVVYVAPKTSASGRVRVYVDGVYAGRFSLWSAKTSAGQIIFRRSWSTSATHTIRIVCDQAGRRVGIDVFVVLR